MYADIPILEAAYRAGVRIDERTLGRVEVEGYCPFCAGSKNHLFLNTEKNQWFCQKCRTGGNAVALYARVRGIDNRAAYQELTEGKKLVFPAPRSPAKAPYIAPLAVRHDVYYDLLSMLGLNQAHREELRRRGLPDERIEANGYRTLPDDPALLDELARRLAAGYELNGVPGFYSEDQGRHWKMFSVPGILIPYCDREGYIQGLQIRLDYPAKRKYCWFSTNPEYKRRDGSVRYPGGTKTKAWIHIAGNVHSEAASITEGALKGDIASYYFGGALYVCTAGVGNVKGLAEVIRGLGVKRAYGCYDMDQFLQGAPSPAVQGMEEEVRRAGILYEARKWDPAYNGIDNFAQHCFGAAV